MYTQCSGCATVFRITPGQLRQAQGLVRCGVCRQEFDALPSLAASLPAAAGIAAQRPPTITSPELGEDLFLALPSVPSEAATVGVPPPRRSGLLGATALLLVAAVLVVLYGYLMREELGRYHAVRPWVELLCGVAGCELAPLRDVGNIHILYKNVEASPSADGLVVHATIVNDAGFRQPYPQVRFRFLDPVGAARASPWFTPDDYLPAQPPPERAAGLPPQEPVAIRLHVGDMDLAAVDNFVIDLR